MRTVHWLAAAAALSVIAGCGHPRGSAERTAAAASEHKHDASAQHKHDASHEHMHGPGHRHMHDGPKATATLQPTRGNAAAGTVTFEQHGNHVMVIARITGLKPNQEHGFHAHEKGDCTSGDGMSTGGHFNPTGKPHGPQNAEHHAGDFPALKADASGKAEAYFHLTGVALGSGPADLVGRGVIVHAGPDDYKTQPTGNAGARIACGVIRAG